SMPKYLVRLKFEIDGIVERPDIIGAIFGQSEGLFGPELDLNELQRTWKVGRIEINLKSTDGKTYGEVLVPVSTDISTAALIAATIESVERVGPYSARFHLTSIDDVRAVKKKAIIERAKAIVKEWTSKTISESEEALRSIAESVKRGNLITYGKEELPAGSGVYTSDTVFLVEGRADVINLLRAGIENVIALNGAKIPESIIKLSKEKKLIAFLDGDRGGDLILKELTQTIPIKGVIRAPPGREVEDLTPMEILELIKGGIQAEPQPAEAKLPLTTYELEKIKELYPQLNGTLEAVILDKELNELSRIPINELITKLESIQGAKYLIFDGIVTQ
ncbi:MAG: DNA primase DnaG, partial [Nitrososphaerales archaeon]|nr:DNA primase DnaG [Nitrososphaerales archaeon]